VWEPLKDNSNFVLLVIGREHNEDELKNFAKKRKLDLPFYPDQDRAIFSQFAPNTIPRNYLIDPNGKVIYAATGYTEKEFNHLVKLINQKVQ
jgi:peroxiredoxin